MNADGGVILSCDGEVGSDRLAGIMRMQTLLSFLYSASLFAQALGSITGVVSDSTGAMIAAADVEAIHSQTGVSSKTQTNSAGVFRFASLPIGGYDLRMTVAGFKTWTQRGVLLETDRTVRIDAVLEIGGTQESVTVQAEAPLLEKETSVTPRRYRSGGSSPGGAGGTGGTGGAGMASSARKPRPRIASRCAAVAAKAWVISSWLWLKSLYFRRGGEPTGRTTTLTRGGSAARSSW